MRVDELIRTEVITVGSDEPLVGCAKRMSELEIRHLPVRLPTGEVVGVATDDGVFAHGALVGDGDGWVWFSGDDRSITARDVAVQADVVAAPDADLGATLRRLAKSPRDFVLVQEGAALRGILTEHDLLRAAAALVPADAALPVSTPVATVSPDTRADHALDLQVRLGFRHLVVVDGDGRAVGVVSRRDLLTAWPRDAKVGDLLGGRVLVAVAEGWTIGPAITAMRELRVGCLPALDRQGRPTGVVTRRDVLQRVVSGLEDEALFG